MAIETMVYNTQGTCSKQIILQVEDDIVKNAEFIGGCQGNLTGIASLIIGMNVHDVVARLQGIKCGAKQTSCPDQLATCLVQYIEKKSANMV